MYLNLHEDLKTVIPNQPIDQDQSPFNRLLRSTLQGRRRRFTALIFNAHGPLPRSATTTNRPKETRTLNDNIRRDTSKGNDEAPKFLVPSAKTTMRVDSRKFTLEIACPFVCEAINKHMNSQAEQLTENGWMATVNTPLHCSSTGTGQ